MRQVVAPTQSVPNGVHSSMQAFAAPTAAHRQPSSQSTELVHSGRQTPPPSSPSPAAQVSAAGQLPSSAQGNGASASGSSAHAARRRKTAIENRLMAAPPRYR